MTRRRVILGGVLALATATGIYDAGGRRVGTIKETPGGRVDVFDAESNRAGWGRRNADGSLELFAPDGERLGVITRDKKVRTMDNRKGGRP